jgi:lysine biosynthesis protein LysW
MSICPKCETDIRLTQEVMVGNRVLCPNCMMLLEVVSEEPMELTQVPELVEGDWAD